jgi:hypothetical protein
MRRIQMFRIGSSALTGVCILMLTVLGACGGQQVPQAGGLLSGQTLSQLVPAAEHCGGSGGVKVRPCPVTITKKRDMPEVKVSGPNVVDSAIKTNSKNRSGCGEICGVGQLSSNSLAYYVSAGSKCGSAALAFYGYDQDGNTVGIGNLEVINKDC